MKIYIRFKGTPRSPALIEHTSARVRSLLGRPGRDIRSVVVCFEDVNGPKAGVDKRCIIYMTGSFGTNVVDTRDTEFTAAADRAIDLCARFVLRFDRSRHRGEAAMWVAS